MEITVLFFGTLIDIAQTSSLKLKGISSSKILHEELIRLYPALKNKTYTIALNKELIFENEVLNNGDTIALLPPFSGG